MAYEIQMRDWTVEELVASLPIKPDPFIIELLTAVEDRGTEVDRLLAEKATGWSLERMPPIDLAVMRIAVAELLGG